MTGWKVLTHDGRSPLQGGASWLTGPFPLTLPRVHVDDSSAECAAGWHFTRQPETALRIAGLWPDGWPSRLFLVEAEDVITRGDKCRAARLTLCREAHADEWETALMALSQPFAPHVAVMVEEQQAWRRALARPDWKPDRIPGLLQQALAARKLPWILRQFPTARDAWAAWAARDARDARAAWDAWDAWAAWDAWDAWDARNARNALIVQYVRRQGWEAGDPAAWTVGIRDAYQCGLAVALPTGPKELGWATASTLEVNPHEVNPHDGS